MKHPILIVTMVLGSLAAAHAQNYYKNAQPLFSMRPDPTKTANPVTEFGPVGMSLDLMKPNFIITTPLSPHDSPSEHLTQKANS